MALTVTEITRTTFGKRRAVLATVTFDSSYATGGEDFTPAAVGLVSFDAVFATASVNSTPVAEVVRFDAANNKLLAFNSTTGAPSNLVQVASTTDLSAFSTVVLAIGV
jgi:hypothetical protein